MVHYYHFYFAETLNNIKMELLEVISFVQDYFVEDHSSFSDRRNYSILYGFHNATSLDCLWW